MNFANLLASYWKTLAVIAGVAGVAVVSKQFLGTEKTRAERAQRSREKQIRAVANRISNYGDEVHRRYPSGDVVIGESDLAVLLRKHPDIVGTALNLLLGEHKVQKAPLEGYWKLNV